MTELIVILVVALLFIGPDKLPEVAKTLGKGLRELRKATDDIRDSVNHTVADAVREVAHKPKDATGAGPGAPAAPATPADPAADPAPPAASEGPTAAAPAEPRVPASREPT